MIPSSFIYNVLHRSHSCVTCYAISIAGVHVSSSSALRCCLPRRHREITRHYRDLSFLHGDWPWQTTNLSSLLSSPGLANLLLVWQLLTRVLRPDQIITDLFDQGSLVRSENYFETSSRIGIVERTLIFTREKRKRKSDKTLIRHFRID